jgi:hypothetical protein
MKHRIVADGADKLHSSPELQARLRQLRADIRERHASELASAGFFRRLILQWQIWMEFRRERRKIVPSSGSLYASRLSAGV